MKIKLTFEGDQFEEQEAIKDLLNVTAYKAAVWEFDQWLRSNVKYEDKKEAPFDEIREKFWQCFESHGVSIE